MSSSNSLKSFDGQEYVEVSDSMMGQDAVRSLSQGKSSPEYKSQDSSEVIESLQSTPIDESEDSEMQEVSSVVVCEEAKSAVNDVKYDLEEFEYESQECGQDCASDEDYQPDDCPSHVMRYKKQL